HLLFSLLLSPLHTLSSPPSFPTRRSSDLTSIIPPLAAFFMKVLSFGVTEEALAAGVSSAIATPAKLNAAIIRGRIQNCEITVILVLMVLIRLKHAGIPSN